MTEEQELWLVPYAEMLRIMILSLRGMSFHVLTETLNAANVATVTNCGSWSYRAAQILKAECVSEIRRRQTSGITPVKIGHHPDDYDRDNPM
jgi:hypothetical protein